MGLVSGNDLCRISSLISPVSSESESLRKRSWGLSGKPSLPRSVLSLVRHFSHVHMSAYIWVCFLCG